MSDVASFDERRRALASGLLDDMERLRAQLFAPVTERRALTVSDGKDLGSHVEVVDIELDEPTFAAKRLIVASIAEAVTKVAQLAGSESDDGHADGQSAGWAGIAAVPDLAEVRDTPKPKPANPRRRSGGGRKAAG